MQNRIENPFGAQRGGQTQSKFHASDSAQNQLRIAPESKAESLTVTAPNVRSLAEAAVPRPALLPCLHCTTPLPSLETIMYVKRIFHCVWAPREPGSQRAFVVAFHTPWE